MSPLISVILPTYNRAPYLVRAIRSVLSQTYSNLELLVVDDASTDNTAEVVRSITDSRLIYHQSRDRLGVSRARNLGIQHARGELIAFQDSDDEWRIEKLAKQVGVFHTNGDCTSLILCGYICPDDVSMSYLGLDKPDGVVDMSSLVVLRIPPAPCWLARKSDLQAVGAFDEQMNCFEDWELALRLSAVGRILMVNEALHIYHRTSGSLFSTESNYIHNLQRIIERHGALLRKQPVAWCYYCNLLGQTECQYGNLSNGRRWFAKAIAARPLGLRAWVNLLVSTLGGRVFRYYVRSARKWRVIYSARIRQPAQL